MKMHHEMKLQGFILLFKDKIGWRLPMPNLPDIWYMQNGLLSCENVHFFFDYFLMSRFKVKNLIVES